MPGRRVLVGSVSSWPVIGVAISPGATALTVMACAASSMAAFDGGGPGELPESALGRAVGRAVGRGADPGCVLVHAGDVDDPTASSGRDHPARGALQAQEGAVEVGREHAAPGVEVQVEQRCGGAVDTAEGIGEVVDEVVDDGGGLGQAGRSRWWTSARRPVARTSSAVRSAPSRSLCHVTPTSQPARASATAVARPMPESDPVTIAVRGKSSGVCMVAGCPRRGGRHMGWRPRLRVEDLRGRRGRDAGRGEERGAGPVTSAATRANGTAAAEARSATVLLVPGAAVGNYLRPAVERLRAGGFAASLRPRPLRRPLTCGRTADG